MNEEISKRIKRGIINYYQELQTKYFSDISEVLSNVNSLLITNERYTIGFKILGLELLCEINKIENETSSVVESVLFATLNPCKHFYPLILGNGDFKIVITDIEEFKIYILNLLETPVFGKLFCKWFPDLDSSRF